MKQLKLGTRKSLLALAQSTLVAREIEKLHPEVKVELVGIETRGDKILDLPLSGIEGKEFFVAEIDDALRSGQVDITVHSMKDLSLDRPKEFVCGAVPKRENPRDILVFNSNVTSKLREGKVLKIGTSAPRRLENVPPFLDKALPRVGPPPTFDMIEIRGNVNTRVSRIKLPETDPNYLDGVVLAFAGLIRLWKGPTSRIEIQKLLYAVKWMVLPVQECPPAPGQGALAIECRSSDFESRRLISSIHHAMTETQIKAERKILEEWGGGCHQKMGACSVAAREVGSVLFVRGRRPDDSLVEEVRWAVPLPLKSNKQEVKSWDGTLFRSQEQEWDTQTPTQLNGVKAAFVAHARAARKVEFGDARVWTSGVSSWFKLAEQGIWVEGCAENLGIESLLSTLKEGVLQLPEFNEWTVLTHEKGIRSWEKEMPGARIVGTYQVGPAPAYVEAISEADVVYWGSATQFDTLRDRVKGDVIHACGPGKTAARLRAAGIEIRVFPSAEEFRKWIQSSARK